MIQRLRKRFIRIAMLSVALVLLALTLIVNIANFVSKNFDYPEKPLKYKHIRRISD